MKVCDIRLNSYVSILLYAGCFLFATNTYSWFWSRCQTDTDCPSGAVCIAPSLELDMSHRRYCSAEDKLTARIYLAKKNALAVGAPVMHSQSLYKAGMITMNVAAVGMGVGFGVWLIYTFATIFEKEPHVASLIYGSYGAVGLMHLGATLSTVAMTRRHRAFARAGYVPVRSGKVTAITSNVVSWVVYGAALGLEIATDPHSIAGIFMLAGTSFSILAGSVATSIWDYQLSKSVPVESQSLTVLPMATPVWTGELKPRVTGMVFGVSGEF